MVFFRCLSILSDAVTSSAITLNTEKKKTS